MKELDKLDSKSAELLILTQVRKHLGNSQALQKLGIEVNIEVCRLPNEEGEVIATISDREVAKNAILEEAVPVYQLRAQHEMNAQKVADGTFYDKNKPEIITPRQVYELVIRQNYMYPKGGYTKVELIHPVTGKSYIGECHFSIHTIFNKKLANSRAFGKMFSKMLEDSSMGRKQGKQVINALLT